MLRLTPPAPRRRWNLTPLVDVIFMLLLFFMLSARLVQERSLVLVHDSAAGEGGATPTTLVLRMAAQGQWFADETELTLARLPQRLQRLAAQEAPVQVRIQVPPQSPVAPLVHVMGLVRAAGLPMRLEAP